MKRDQTWLALLLADAGLEDLDRLRQELLDDGVDPELVEAEAVAPCASTPTGTTGPGAPRS